MCVMCVMCYVSSHFIYLPIHSNALKSISLKRLSGSTCLTGFNLSGVFGVFGVFEVFKGSRSSKVKQVFYDDPMLKYVFHRLIYNFDF